MSVFSDVMRYWRFSVGLREHLREPFTLDQSKEIIKRRMERRAETFLAILRKAVYENEKSPYLKLLKLAGCEYVDLESMTRAQGIEATLKKLSDEGVWLSLEEFNGRKEVARGGKVFRFKESDFDNPFFSRYFEAGEGAGRRAGTRTTMGLDFWAQEAVCYPPILDANNALEVPFAMWRPALAQGGELFLLIFAKAGNSPIKWFSQVDKRAIKPSLKKRMVTGYLVYLGRIFGARWSRPQHVVLSDAEVPSIGV